MKVLIADKFEQSGRDGLEAIGCEVFLSAGFERRRAGRGDRRVRAGCAGRALDESVRRRCWTAGAIKLVVRAGAGYNTIDVAAASRRGIYVSNCPGKNSIAVAELAFALMLALDRRIADNVISLRQGQWNKKEFSKARGLYGRTLGLIGVGKIGQEMIPRARAFGMPVVAWSRSLTPERAAEFGVEYKDEPAGSRTRGGHRQRARRFETGDARVIGADFFDAMREGAYFINTARGEVVDQSARLQHAMQARGIRAGLDVFAGEPTSATGEFTDEIATGGESLRHASHRRFDRSGAGSHRRRNRPHHARRSRRPAKSRTSSTSPSARPPRTCSSSATAIVPACWPQCSTPSARRTSTCRRWRTSSLKARRPPSRASISKPRRQPRRWTNCAPRTQTSSNSIC